MLSADGGGTIYFGIFIDAFGREERVLRESAEKSGRSKGAVKKVGNLCAETTEHCIKTLFSDAQGRLFSQLLLQNRNLWRNVLKFENVKVELAVEEWLAYLHGAQYIVTDSFHGTCFALIFQKPFVSFVNREPGRFEFFHKVPGVGERILEIVGEEGLQVFDKPLAYAVVERYLTAERERSLAWLDAALL